MSEEFRMVTRKKWIARKKFNKQTAQPAVPGEYIKSRATFIKNFECLCKRMETSEYFTQAMGTIKKSLSQVSKTTVQRLVCFGIGPFTRDFLALHQLAFVCSAQHYFDIKEAIFYDPVFSECEKQILMQLDCNVMNENCVGKYEANALTLFYLPHCPTALTNNLLWSNWRCSTLPNVVLINNSFDMLTSTKAERDLRVEGEFILNISKYTKESPLENDYSERNVFNDLSVHTFSAHELPAEDSEFWAERMAPVYPDTEEFTEMISAINQFGNMKIS